MDHSEQFAEWEHDLLPRSDQNLPEPTAADRERSEQDASNAAAAQAECAVLDVPPGPGATVDLTGVWEPIRLSQAHYEYRGRALVVRLADRAAHGRGWIVAQRLLQAVDAMSGSADGQVYMQMPAESAPGRVEIIAWCWDGPLPWRVEAALDVRVEDGRTRITGAAPVVLTTRDWDSGAITYADGAGTLAAVVAGWLTGWMGRLGLQGAAGLVGPESGELPEAPSVEQFAGSL
ncbi:hypothetical protein DQ384_36580 [Sphaerisporangium album]|uniref:Uncharacterized protein n=1 Tax=Sphaerisporangium album TaxID=509200 RepID=A0A367ESR6_9ACTN|nr:hypothetical protein [Sphaerisporangium album]RCG21134.1 hypothetical protein DQ384_36580 [Sphaerisporangium album]